MVGLSRRLLRPKPIDFLLPWLHRRDIKSRRRIKQKLWRKERSEMEINVRYFPHLTRENGPMKTIMHFMVGLSRRRLRPKPIYFLLWTASTRHQESAGDTTNLSFHIVFQMRFDKFWNFFLFKIKFFYVFRFVLIYGSKIFF